MEYAVFKQQIMEQAKRILPQEEGYVITIVDQTEYGLGEMLIINKSDKEVVPGISMEEMYQDFSQNKKSIEEVIETIPFEEEKRNNPAIDRGTENTLQEGVEGQRSIRYIVKYDNGQEIERAQISNEVISEAKNQVIEVGTKLPVVVSSGGVT